MPAYLPKLLLTETLNQAGRYTQQTRPPDRIDSLGVLINLRAFAAPESTLRRTIHSTDWPIRFALLSAARPVVSNGISRRALGRIAQRATGNGPRARAVSISLHRQAAY